MAKSRARKLADLIVTAGVDIDGNLTFDGGSTSADLTFADNDKANFGDASDLQIYHDGSSNLIQGSNGSLYIQAKAGENSILATPDGGVNIYHDNSLKLETTAAGINVTGTVTADDTITLSAIPTSLDENRLIFNETPATGSLGSRILWRNPATGYDYASVGFTNEAGSSGGLRFKTASSVFNDSDTVRMNIASNGDISFYEDTGTTAKLFWDASAEALGIGTNSPQSFAKLQVNTATDRNAAFFDNAAGTTLCGITDAGASTSLRLAGFPLLFTGNGGGGAEHMRIDSNGKLTYGGISYGVAVDPDGSGGFGAGYNFETNGGSPRHLVTGPLSGQYLSSGSSPFIAWYTAATAATATTAAERMRIDSSGNLLVGTTSTSTQSLTSGGGIVFSSAGAIAGAYESVNTVDPVLSLNNTGADGSIITLKKDGTTFGKLANDSTAFVVTGASTGLKFGSAAIWPTTGGGVANSTGAKDLGASTVKFKDLYLTGYAYVGALKTNASVESASNLTFWVANLGEAARIEQGTGNVGIGTSSPTTSLHVERSSGNATQLVNATANNTRATIETKAKTNAGVEIRGVLGSYGDANKVDIGTLTNHPLAILTNNTERVRIDASGKVGIGTTYPYFPLQVQGTNITNGAAKTTALFFDTTSAAAGTGGGIAFGGYTNGTGGDLYHFGNIQGIKENSTAGDYASALLFSTRENGAAPVERMRISSGGTVGIGVTPSDDNLATYKLQLYADPQCFMSFGNPTTGSGNNNGLVIGNDNNGADIYQRENQYLRFHTNNSERMRIAADGNVGIGTSSPGTKLDIVTSTASTDGAARIQYSGANNYEILRLEAPTDNDSILSFKSGASYYWGMGVDFSDSGKFKIARDNLLTVNTAVTIDSSGNVGIGTTSPAVPLHVYNASQGRVAIENASRRFDLAVDGDGLGFRDQSAAITRMRIDTSGRLLVGKSTSNYAVEGVEIRPTEALITKDNGTVLSLNRLTSDGFILGFAKDTATIGSIGVEGGDLTIGTGDTGLQFVDGIDTIRPFNTTTNVDRDGTISLGVSYTRFKDLYLSGGVYLGGTGAANLLDDYEEGTWTPSFGRLSSNPSVSYASTRDGTYVKIGRMVYAFFDMAATSISGGSGNAIILGLPFTVSSSMAGYSVGQYRDASAVAAGTAQTVLKGFADYNSTYIYLQLDSMGTSGYGFNANSSWNSSGRITGYVIYETDS